MRKAKWILIDFKILYCFKIFKIFKQMRYYNVHTHMHIYIFSRK